VCVICVYRYLLNPQSLLQPEKRYSKYSVFYLCVLRTFCDRNERNRIKEWVEEQTKNDAQPLSPKKKSMLPGPDPDVLSSALSKLACKQEQADKQRNALRLRKELNECHAQRDHLVTQKNTLEIKMATLEQTKQQLLEQEQFNYVQGLEEASDEEKDRLAKQHAEKVAQLQGGFEKQVAENSEEVKQVIVKITTLESKIHDLASQLVQLSSEDGHEPFDISSPESCVVGKYICIYLLQW